MSERACECHGKPMRWETDARYTAGGYWRCRVRANEVSANSYANMSGVSYNRMLLKHRRGKALARQQRRNSSEE